MWDVSLSNSKRPLYLAIVDSLEKAIEDGDVKPGDRLPTHRELAKKARVTVTTVTRAYAEAEKRGFVTAVVGRGTFATGRAVMPQTVGDGLSTLVEMGVASPLYLDEPDLKPLIERVLKKTDLSALMRFISPQGLPMHREVGAEWVKLFGVKATADSVLISAGPQHSITSVFHSVFEAGDRIAVEQLTNPVFRSYARRSGLVLESVPLDDVGMIPEKLDELCASRTVRGLYASVQLPESSPAFSKRRQELARVIKKHGLLLVEDDSFNFLGIHKNFTLSSLVPQQSIYISSVSAAFYAGLRVAFIHAPSRYYSRISQAIADNIWMVSPLCAAIACECITSGLGDRIIRSKRKELSKRTSLLREKFSDYGLITSAYSMFAWLKLPSYWTSTDFEQAAEKTGLRVFAAEKFAVGSIAPPNFVRLVLTGPPDFPAYKKGLQILQAVLNREIAYVNLLQ